MNELVLAVARWVDEFPSSTALHESYYMYAWVETTHVLCLMLFLGMLLLIDLRMLGVAFKTVPASTIARQLDKPLWLGFLVMVVTGVALFYAIPVRTTQSVWFRLKLVLLLLAGINALLFRRHLARSAHRWEHLERPPVRVRRAAGASIALWAGVVICGRAIAYDWYDCHKALAPWLYQLAGCVDELAQLGLDDA